ncbi:MAG: TetR/AcrR family transcriptional regulator [Pseudomonadota bacterium]
MSTKERIEKAAEGIIRTQGIDGLTMRHLAETAEVALKTPYNLYGSKTGVLLALLDRTTNALLLELMSDDSPLVLQKLFNALATLGRFYSEDEDYLRLIFWAVMTSNHPQERAAAHANIVAIVSANITEAHAEKELSPKLEPAILGEQLGLNLLANLGSWAGGHLSMEATISHTKSVWLALIAPQATKKAKTTLAAYSASL